MSRKSVRPNRLSSSHGSIAAQGQRKFELFSRLMQLAFRKLGKLLAKILERAPFKKTSPGWGGGEASIVSETSVGVFDVCAGSVAQDAG